MSTFGLLRIAVVALLLAPSIGRASGSWWNRQWSERKLLRIDTSAAGAGITEPIGPTAVLVRLHVGDFAFESTKEDGSDLRFVASDDRTLLRFHLEKYDAVLGEALVWVGFPELKPGAQTDVWLYYGNPKAPPPEEAKATYDPGTVLVYHFGERGQPPRDSSSWGNHAASTGLSIEGAIIGRGLRLNGSSTVSIPPTASIAWVAGASMTWSAWLRPSADGMTGVLFSRRDKANAFVVGLDEGRPYVEVGAAAGVARTTATAPLPAGGWHHLAVTTGEAMTLYVDGSPVAKLAAKLPALGTAALVGGDKVSPASPARPRGRVAGSGRGGATPGFEVDLDELEIALGERPPGYIRTAALSQASDPGKFLAAGEPEVRRSWGSGNFAIIVRSVTFDGWIVIGLLAVMAAVSWMVLVEKGLHLRAVRRANARFLERFRPASADLHRLLQAGEGASPLGEEAELADSPLYRLFRVAAEDVRRHTDGGRPLTPEGLAAVRSALDTTLAEEVDALARRMVVLTIAISGGPFLGLLGTVVGVMITFASIAAAGDVNVTAIAPGIAAALMATVAGLVVAIPSLFGYNWLLTRIKSITRGLQVFVDELVTRSAAACASRPGVPAPAEEPAGSSVREPILAAG